MPWSFGVALCVAYLLGLLLHSCLGMGSLGGIGLPWAGLALLAVGLGWGMLAPLQWQLGLRRAQWVALAIVSSLATMYMTLRSPHVMPWDVSILVERVQAIGEPHLISGTVLDEPSLNRDMKGRFRLAVKRLGVQDAQGHLTFQVPIHGRLYVTAPLLQVTGLHAGMDVTAVGRLYLPQPALNPNGFDFQAYLTQRGTFAGMVAERLTFGSAPPWGLWRLRQRIVRAQMTALGSPLGQLVSAMALGRKAADLPFDIQDLFSRVGLAHTIAASGFHVSLLLGTVLAVVRSRSRRVQVISGLAVLAGFVTLTGLQASVVRAALMGVAALIGLASDRKVNPLGALLTAVTLMLLLNPGWIWDVGFQLSVVATLGLIVTVPGLTRWLDWLPVTLASLVAVPLAATLWTIPLILYHFNVLSGISIVLNAIATPLVTVISLGGIGSSAIALFSPLVGSWVAHLLYLPAQALLWLAQTSSRLPGSAIAIGQISLWQLIGLYGLLGLSLRPAPRPALKPLLWGAFVALITAPLGWQWLTQTQITVLAAGDELLWALQDHGHTTLVNSGDAKTAFYTVAPFLRQAGVNRLGGAIALPFGPDYVAGWQTLLQQTPTQHIYGTADSAPVEGNFSQYQKLAIGQKNNLPHLTVQPLGTDNPILRLSAAGSTWLLLPKLSTDLQTHLAKAGSVLQSQVLLWNGDELSEALLATVRPQVVICYGQTLSEALEGKLAQAGLQVFWTMRDGAVTWRSRQGFQGYRNTSHNSSPWE